MMKKLPKKIGSMLTCPVGFGGDPVAIAVRIAPGLWVHADRYGWFQVTDDEFLTDGIEAWVKVKLSKTKTKLRKFDYDTINWWHGLR